MQSETQQPAKLVGLINVTRSALMVTLILPRTKKVVASEGMVIPATSSGVTSGSLQVLRYDSK